MMTSAEPLACDLCGIKTDSVDTAVASDWSPSYFIGQDDTGRCICSKCTEACCHIASDGELVLNGSDN